MIADRSSACHTPSNLINRGENVFIRSDRAKLLRVSYQDIGRVAYLFGDLTVKITAVKRCRADGAFFLRSDGIFAGGSHRVSGFLAENGR